MTDIRKLMETLNTILSEDMGGQLSFEELCKRRDELGIVILGAGGELSEWAEGISKMLVDEGISESQSVFSEYGRVTGNIAGDEGRTDAYFFFNTQNNLNIGALSIWRIKFGDASWIDDFCNNYRKDYEAGHDADESEADQD